LGDVTVIESSGEEVTTIPCVATTPFCAAEIFAAPPPCPVANPFPFTVATLEFDEVHVTAFVMTCVVLSL
jgi:hypothetical protein